MLRQAKRRAATLGIAIFSLAAVAVAIGRPFGEGRRKDGALSRAGGEATGVPNRVGGGWLVAGPFAARSGAGLSDTLDLDYLALEGYCPAGEASASPLGVDGSSGKLWREVEGTRDPEGAERGVDFNGEFGPTFDSVAYAYREIESKVAGEALIRLGSDDGVKLWINGRLVYANHVRRALLRGEDSLLAPLEPGRNRILVKVSQGRGEWAFSLGLAPRDALRDTDSLAPPLALAARPDSLSAPVGGLLEGSAAPKGGDGGIGRDWRAAVELLDSSGAVRARAEARVGGRFALRLPAGLEGVARLRASGAGRLSGVAATETPIFLGDPDRGAARAAALARAGSAARTAAARYPEVPDPAATLDFLARGVEGSLPSPLASFDLALMAYQEIEALAGDAAAGGSFPRGLWRYAFASPLDGGAQPYSLYLPRDYRREGRYGLVVALHGASNDDQSIAVPLAAARPADMLILAPYCRGDQAYAGAGERDALDAMDLILSRYAIDPDRAYLCGSSMGGYGTWRLAKLFPGRFAAAAPFAGWTELDMLENLLGLPMLVVHGDEDPVIPIESDRRAVDFLGSNGGSVRFDVLAGRGHDALNAWTEAEGAQRLFAWFRGRKRASWPVALRASAAMPRAGRVAWAAILGTREPPAPAAIQARIVDERHVAVETDNVSAFELDLRHPRLATGGRILVLADGVNLTADSGKGRARFELGPDGRFAPARAQRAGSPPNGGSGMVALFDSPLQIVYGTRTRRAADEGRQVAKAIAEDLERARIASPAILSDREAELASPNPAANRLLVGDPDENSALAKLAPELPLGWSKGRFSSPDGTAEGKGLLLVCPDPAREGRLLGVLAPPREGKAAAEFARGIFAPLGFQSRLGPCGYGTPDLALLGPGGEVAWSGYYDWRWERLEKKAMAGK